MRVPDRPSSLPLHSGVLIPVSRGDFAANAVRGGSGTAAQGLAAVLDAMQGHGVQYGSGLARAVAVRAQVTRALDGAGGDADIQGARMAVSPWADGLTRTFGGERTCP